MNLLSNLSHWAHRHDENFLTEAFVYVLQFMLDREQGAAAKLLNQLTAGHLKIKAKDCIDITVTTQVLTDEGRPDIEIRTPSALVYVEVKAESGLGVQQMKRYRAALEKSGYNDTFLCLLTRYPVEEGIDGDKPDLHLRWLQVYEYLDKIENIGDVSRYVLNQFMEFLEKRGIVMDHVSWQLVDGVKSLQNLLNMLGKAIENNEIASVPLRGGREYIGYYTDEKKNWIGIFYEEPASLKFEINTKNAPDDKQLKSLGLSGENMEASTRIVTYVDLSSEDNHFFSRDRTSQQRFLEKQIASWRKTEQNVRQLGL